MLNSITVSATMSNWRIAWQGVDNANYEQYSANHVADEFSSYIEKVTGKKLPVESLSILTATNNILLLTEAKYAPDDIKEALRGKPLDSFIIKYPYNWHGKTVCLLVSNDSHAYDFAVYYFLTEFMHFNWVGPGELGEVFTVQPNWEMPKKIDIIKIPDFSHRFWSMKSFNGRKWLGSSFRMAFHHALGKVFDPNKYGTANPEIYPLLKNGKRLIPQIGGQAGYSHSLGFQPCTTNEKSIEIATRYVLDYLKNHPNHLSASLSINDGAGNVCMCHDCRALDPKDTFKEGQRPNLSDRFFTFYNRVIKRVLKKNSNAYIAVLAYGALKYPPKRVKIHPRILVFCVVPDMEILQKWHNAGAKPNLYYWLWDAGYLKIRPDMHRLAKLIKASKNYGGKGFYSEDLAFWPASGPRFYLLSKLLWNSDSDIDALLLKYCTLTYGKAAGKYINKYYQRWNEIFNRQLEKQQYDIDATWKRISQFNEFKQSDFKFMDKMLQQAISAPKTVKEKQRLIYLLKYQQLLATNAKQFLLAKQLMKNNKINSFDEICRAAITNMNMTAEFNQLWTEEIIPDKSGWLLDCKKLSADKWWQSYYEQLRKAVETECEYVLEKRFKLKIDELLKTKSKDQVIVRLREKIQQEPQLVLYLKPEIDRLANVTAVNIIKNGSFENGCVPKDGRPPMIKNWKTYQEYGMNRGTKNHYKWEKGAGRDGIYAFGLGDGDYAELRSHVRLEKNSRYKLSFWYKTENAPIKSEFQIFYYCDNKKISDITTLETKKFKTFLTLKLPHTDNKWQHYSRTFMADKAGNYILNIDAGMQSAGQWLWLDSIKLIKLY